MNFWHSWTPASAAEAQWVPYLYATRSAGPQVAVRPGRRTRDRVPPPIPHPTPTPPWQTPGMQLIRDPVIPSLYRACYPVGVA